MYRNIEHNEAHCEILLLRSSLNDCEQGLYLHCLYYCIYIITLYFVVVNIIFQRPEQKV